MAPRGELVKEWIICVAPVLAPRGARFENWGCRMGVLDSERRR